MKERYTNIKCQIILYWSYNRIFVDGKDQYIKMNYSNKCNPIYSINDFLKENVDEQISKEQKISSNTIMVFDGLFYSVMDYF